MKILKVIGLFFCGWLLVLSGCPSSAPEPDTVTVHFIDVGQGDSILIDIGETEVLIDGGEKNTGAAEYINPYVDGAIEAVVATHFDADHIGGLISVFEQYDVNEFWYNGKISSTKTATDLMNLVRTENAAVYETSRGDEIKVGVLTLGVLNPVKPLSGDANHNSIVLDLSYGETEFLFMGDADQAAETSMLDLVHDIDILKVGHHGSRYSSSPEFLNIVKPEAAIYMAGKDNQYGHPHQETLDALADIHAKVYGTDNCGTIKIITDGSGYEIMTEK